MTAHLAACDVAARLSISEDSAYRLMRRMPHVRIGRLERPAFPGCGDNSCVVRFPLGGVGTNGGCRCDESVLLLGALTLRRYALALEARLGGAP